MAREKGKREKEELKEKEKAEKEILTKGKKAPMINLCRSGFAPHACFPHLISKKLLSQGPHFYWIGSFFNCKKHPGQHHAIIPAISYSVYHTFKKVQLNRDICRSNQPFNSTVPRS